MDKAAIIKAIITEIEKEAETLTAAAQTSFNDATDEESKAESKYDTRGLETSYLASGQARMAVEAQESLARFKALSPKAFSSDDRIALSACIEVKTKRETSYYFLGPSSGGIEVEHEGKRFMVITPQSPVGRNLLGKKMGDAFKMQLGRSQEELTIAKVY